VQEERGGKVDIIVCSVVASIANKFVVGDELPKVPYRTLVDLYVDLCFLLIMVSMASVFLVFYVYGYYFPVPGAEHDDGGHETGGETYYGGSGHDDTTDGHDDHDDHGSSEGHRFFHRLLSGGLHEELPETTHTAIHYAWQLNWILFGASFFIFFVFNCWLLVQIYCVKNDLKRWKTFNPLDDNEVGHRTGLILRESHFLHVAGTHHHHIQQSSRRSPSQKKADEVTDPDFVNDLMNEELVAQNTLLNSTSHRSHHGHSPAVSGHFTSAPSAGQQNQSGHGHAVAVVGSPLKPNASNDGNKSPANTSGSYHSPILKHDRGVTEGSTPKTDLPLKVTEFLDEPSASPVMMDTTKSPIVMKADAVLAFTHDEEEKR
jgi:hypothetical protein